MPSIIIISYLLVILIAVSMAAAIVFHMLHYRINRKVASLMFIIYLAGIIILIFSNFTFFGLVNWDQIITNFGF